ncbi:MULTISPECIES: ASCH domain-containing protein [unclassified Mycobacterium]|uniref:ASCH domain-containing protein n=1 Tax=unclassified Mycobacterium TaxID=2642494 RepID=UPI0029C6A6C3|nr:MULTISPECIES: ASCH domain-containing protein [unclassified Mycobacterium]
MRSLGGNRSSFTRVTDGVRASDHGPEQAGRPGESVPRGLIVRDPYASQLLNGEKIWEIRGRPTRIRGPVVIVKQGSGKAYGIANLVRVLGPLDLEDLVASPEVPSQERADLRRDGLPYRRTYAYVFTSPRWFEHPVSYRHPNGAVTWVRLPDLDLDHVECVAPSLRIV